MFGITSICDCLFAAANNIGQRYDQETAKRKQLSDIAKIVQTIAVAAIVYTGLCFAASVGSFLFFSGDVSNVIYSGISYYVAKDFLKFGFGLQKAAYAPITFVGNVVFGQRFNWKTDLNIAARNTTLIKFIVTPIIHIGTVFDL